MNTTRRIAPQFHCSLTVAIFLLACYAVRAATLNASDISLNARKVKCSGATFFILTPPVVTPDEVPLTVILENCGKTDFLCGETGYLADCILTMRDGKGEAIPYTTSGGNLFGPEQHAGHSQYALVKYERGKIRKWEYNIAAAFKTLKPGKYTLSFEARMFSFWDDKTKEFSNRQTPSCKDIPIIVQEQIAAK